MVAFITKLVNRRITVDLWVLTNLYVIHSVLFYAHSALFQYDVQFL